MKFKRIFLIVVDSLGVGALPDAAAYGDEGTDTLGHIAQQVPLSIPNLTRLGLANLHPIAGISPVAQPLGYHGYLQEKSQGKDTLTGHWEMMGIHTTEPFQTFTDTGFPPDLIAQLEAKTGRTIIGNKSASGTEILEELGETEIQEGKLIVYTSADSVLQICGNEETMGLETLYSYCEIARQLTMRQDWRVARVIARPYTGSDKTSFVRTANRHDYALSPPKATALDILKSQGLDVISVGKIHDIFNGNGLTQSHKSKSSVHGMEQTIDLTKTDFTGLCFTNLVDFDALWGHRRNPQGYAQELEKFDEKLGDFLQLLGEDDLVLLTSDHGNDPTHRGTDHTREHAFLLAYGKAMTQWGALPTSDTFGAIGATILDNFSLTPPAYTIGQSLLDQLI